MSTQKTKDGFKIAMGSSGSWNGKCVAVKTYSNSDIIEIKNTDHYFKNSEKKILKNMEDFLK